MTRMPQTAAIQKTILANFMRTSVVILCAQWIVRHLRLGAADWTDTLAARAGRTNASVPTQSKPNGPMGPLLDGTIHPPQSGHQFGWSEPLLNRGIPGRSRFLRY